MRLSRYMLFALLAGGVLAALPPQLGALARSGDSDGRAGSWRKAGQGSPSVEACRKRVQDNPKDADAQNDLGWALRQHDDLAGAESALKEAIKLMPGLPQAHSNLSVVLLDKHDAAGAVAEGRQAVSLDGGKAIYHVVLGNALSAGGDRKTAIEEYRAALKLKPDYENAMFHLGATLFDDGQMIESKKALSYALGLDPDDGRVLELMDKIMKSEKQ